MEPKPTTSIRSNLSAGDTGEDEFAREKVSGLIVGLNRVYRTYQTYGPANPSTLRAISRLRSYFEDLWEHETILCIQVLEGSLVWNEKPMLQVENRRDSLPFLLYQDGIRELSFFPGFENEELEDFVEVLYRVLHRQADADDLQTLLWERDFSSLHYGVASLPAGDTGTPKGSSARRASFARVLIHELDAKNTDAAGSSVARSAVAEPGGFIEAPTSPSTAVQPLNSQDWAYVQQELAEEMGRDVSVAVVAALLDSLEDSSQDNQSEIVGMLADLLRHFVAHGQLRTAAELLNELQGMLDRPEVLLEECRSEIRRLFQELPAWSEVERLFRALEVCEFAQDGEVLKLFLDHLGGDALARMLQVATRLQEENLRDVVESRVECIASQEPDSLLDLLGCEDFNVVSRALDMIGRLQHTQAAAKILVFLGHSELHVRLAAVTALTNLDSSVASEGLLGALDDASPKVRSMAAAGLAAHGYRAALPRLQELLLRNELQELGSMETKTLLVAYARIGQAESVPVLDRLLNGSRFLLWRRPAHVRVCAALALAHIDLPEAKHALGRSLHDRNALVGAVVRRALLEGR